MEVGGFKPIRDGKGQLVGWTRKDPRSGVTQIYNKNSETIGWAKEDDASGPGYTMMSKGNIRVAQGFNPEYLLGMYNAAPVNDEPKDISKPTNWLFKGQGTDGSDPGYKK